jgi:hypothetical protein
MVPFTVLARSGCTTHANLALALTAEFAALRDDPAQRALDELAFGLLDARAARPGDQLQAVADLAAAHLEAVTLDCAIDDLLLDRVAISGAGHQLLLTIACAEAGRRAGLALGVVAGPDGAFVAHFLLAEPLVADPATGRVLDVRSLSAPLSLQCSHQAVRASSIASASAPRAWATSRGRYGRPSCSWPCRSSPARASAWSPTCAASARG